jgi:threonine dehydratase
VGVTSPVRLSAPIPARALAPSKTRLSCRAGRPGWLAPPRSASARKKAVRFSLTRWVICVQPLGAPALTHSWRQRRAVTTDSTNTIADGVAGRCPIPAVLDDLLLVADDAVLVQEASIIAGMRMLLDHAGLVVEPSAALGIAAVLEDRDRFAGRHAVTIVCGSNVDVDAYHRWVGAAPLHRS